MNAAQRKASDLNPGLMRLNHEQLEMRIGDKVATGWDPKRPAMGTIVGFSSGAAVVRLADGECFTYGPTEMHCTKIDIVKGATTWKVA